MAQIKNNLVPVGKTVGFTLSNTGSVEFVGECEISEEDLLSAAAKPKTKYQQAKEMIERMLRQSDRTYNEVHNACIDAGINPRTISDVKRDYLIQTVKKLDDWYWTIVGSKWDDSAKEPAVSDVSEDVAFVTLDDRPISEMLPLARDVVPEDRLPDNRPELDMNLFEPLHLVPPPKKRGSKVKPVTSICLAGSRINPEHVYDDLQVFDWRGCL
jgi:hypothetical protein